VSIQHVDSKTYVAKRKHKRDCFSCGGAIRIGDRCVSTALVYDGRLYSTVEHEPCCTEANRLSDGDENGYSERALSAEYWGPEEWTPEYAAWRATRDAEVTP